MKSLSLIITVLLVGFGFAIAQETTKGRLYIGREKEAPAWVWQVATASANTNKVAANTSWLTALNPGATTLQPAPAMANQSNTNNLSANLAAGLTTLRSDVQQALPVLVNFKDSVVFINAGPGLKTRTSGGTQSLAANFSEDLSRSYAVNLAEDLGQDLSVPTSAIPSLPMVPSRRSLPVANGSGLVSLGAAQAFASVPPFGESGSAFGFNSAQNAIRALLILQKDLEGVLPMLATVSANSHSLSATAGFTASISGLKETSPNDFGQK